MAATGQKVCIDVLVCTFRRPSVARTLRSVAAQELPPDTGLRIVVADNDATPSSRRDIEGVAATLSVPVVYLHAPHRNISIARNACLDAARASWVAFIDDDEVATPQWLARLLSRAEETGADAVFGPALADYPPESPAWMRRLDIHSNIPAVRDGIVETGHTCNALLRFSGTRWSDRRFDVGRGRSGGEDTEFFFRVRRLGARFAVAGDAVVREPVTPERLSMRWLMQRRFRMGQSYAARVGKAPARARLAGSAAAKAAFCAVCAAARVTAAERRNFWTLRMALHSGVVAGCARLPQAELYGNGD